MKSNDHVKAHRLCPSCGEPMEYRGYRHVEHIGNVKVVDSTAFAWQCSKCEECDLTLEDLAGYERRAAALVLRDGTHVNGSVIRSARKALGLRQTELAVLLGCEPETLSRWETGSRIMPRAEQLALVALLDGVEQGIVDIVEQISRSSSGNALESPLELEVPSRRAVG